MAETLILRKDVDLAASLEREWCMVRQGDRTLRLRTGGGYADSFGGSWALDGDARTLDLGVTDRCVGYGEYPDAMERLLGCLRSSRFGYVVLSAAPGHTFGEVSGGFHTASDHGSLACSEPNVSMLASGMRAPRRITDAAPTLLDHFGTNPTESVERHAV